MSVCSYHVIRAPNIKIFHDCSARVLHDHDCPKVKSPLTITTEIQNKWNQFNPASGDGDVMICEEQENYFSVNCPKGSFRPPQKHYVFSRPISCGPLMDSTPCSPVPQCLCVCGGGVGAPSASTPVNYTSHEFHLSPPPLSSSATFTSNTPADTHEQCDWKLHCILVELVL